LKLISGKLKTSDSLKAAFKAGQAYRKKIMDYMDDRAKNPTGAGKALVDPDHLLNVE